MTVGAVSGGQRAVVQPGQFAGIVEADARPPVDRAFRLVVELIIALEDVLTLAFGNALARVGDGQLHTLPVVKGVERDVDAAAPGRELHGVGHDVVEYLLYLVSVEPCRQTAFQPLRANADALLLGIDGVDVEGTPQDGDDVRLLHVQPQGVVLQLVEVEQLVDKPEHAFHAAGDDVEQPAVDDGDALVVSELLHGSGDHGERGAELVRDVGKEAHVHLVEPLLLLALILRFLGEPFLLADASARLSDIPHDGGGCQEVETPGPPRVPRFGRYAHLDGPLGQGTVRVVAHNLHAEGVVARRQVGVVGLVVAVGIGP